MNSRTATLIRLVKRDKYLLLMFSPIFIYYLVIMYFPMPGVIMAFKNFTPGKGIFSGDWVGLKWFIQFYDSIYFWRLLRNTFLLAFLPLLFGFPIPILFAICVVEIKNRAFKRFAQTITYLPHFISTVVIAGMLINFLSPTDGIVNILLEKIGLERVNFMMEPGWFRTIFTSSDIWQSFGFSSIIYIAAIMSIDPEMYDSGKIDGVNKFQELWHLTLPSIKPTIIILLLLSLGGIMSVGFEKVYLLYNAATYETGDVLSTYVYRMGIIGQNYSFATAIGVFNSIITFILVFAANQLTRRATNMSLW
ncbi:putative aldouronate transport system permease protein [Paenibacillus algorifonticola]|uniref:Putative aldouronate transport system permease protein n=2 Tax=Paenibacillus algorifonticola TaxID=684063 RepID=A0A1I1ZW25_9BACL|nr:ABC transporter permease subunit [Paenibacillus algorifonticola]SFE35767.1 putative aldouronate transport system permease protein [Paenibacillus algorifonticola]